MNDEQLLKILDEGGEIAIPYFDQQLVRVEPCELEPQEALPALRHFLGLSNAQRLSDGRHLLAYLKYMMLAAGEEEILEDLGGKEPGLDAIWDHVQVSHIFFGKLEKGKYAQETTVYLQLEGNVDWEPEHGLQMSWARGAELVKVGAFDGHPTNGHASANPDDDQYIFIGLNPETSTKAEDR